MCQLDGAALVACENIEQVELEAPGGEELIFAILDARYPESAPHDKVAEALKAVHSLRVMKD
eukprot:9023727-Lingulodinium_polyedra.AAC.1